MTHVNFANLIHILFKYYQIKILKSLFKLYAASPIISGEFCLLTYSKYANMIERVCTSG